MRKQSIFSILLGLSAMMWAVLDGYGQAPKSAVGANTPDGRKKIITQYCVACHSGKLKDAPKVFPPELDIAHVEKDPEVWEKVVRKMRAGVMPPEGARRPDAEPVGLRRRHPRCRSLLSQAGEWAAHHANPCHESLRLSG